MMDCRSSSVTSSSSSPSPLQVTSPRNLENVVLENVLNASPRLSSYSKPIVQLERRFADNQASNGNGMQQSSEELRKEIAKLEFQILHLEGYLLSLYRTAFEERVPSLSNVSGTPLHYSSSSPSPVAKNLLFCKSQPHIQNGAFGYDVPTTPIHETCLSNSRRFSPGLMTSSTRDRTRSASGHRSLADLLGASNMLANIVTPNTLSEEIVTCIASIYCKISNRARTYSGFSASPSSSLSSSSVFSSKNPCDSLSPRCNEDSLGNQHFEVLKICLDDETFRDVAVMLQNFRTLVRSLEKVDPRKMTREEKIAFWINIHNALVMHAHLAYETHNRMRSTSILKAAYDVGGHCINACVIQSSILGIQRHHSAPLLQTLFSPGRKSKTCSIRHVYALEYAEPLVHFALSWGAFTDPVVRVYTAHNIFWHLRHAKEEFVQANVRINKGTKILLPRILYYYVKDMSLDMARLVEAISGCLPETEKKAARKCWKERKHKCIEWLPENSSFRYLFHGELAGGRMKV